MTSPAERIRKLREIADAATPGPWTVSDIQGVSVWAQSGQIMPAEIRVRSYNPAIHLEYMRKDVYRADAAFISAFNPETAKALLDVATAALEEQKVWCDTECTCRLCLALSSLGESHGK